MEEQKLQANGSNAQQQFQHTSGHTKAYDSEEQRQTYQNTQSSYNQQRSNYAQAAYNAYEVGVNVLDILHNTDGISDTQVKATTQSGYDYEKNLSTESNQNLDTYQRYHYDQNEIIQKSETSSSLLNGEEETEYGEITLGTSKTPKYTVLEEKKIKTSDKLQRTSARRKLLDEKIPTKLRLAYDTPDYVRNQRVMNRLIQESEAEKEEDGAETEKKDKKDRNSKSKKKRLSPVRKLKDATEEKVGRLHFVRKQISEKDYKKKIRRKEEVKFLVRRLNDTAYRKTFEDADQEVKELATHSHRAYRYVGHQARHNIKTIKKYSNPYSRLKFAKEKESVLQDKLKHQEHKYNNYPRKEQLKAAREEERTARADYRRARLQEQKTQLAFEHGNLEFEKSRKLKDNARRTETEKLKQQAEAKTRRRKEMSRKMAQTRNAEEGKFFTRVKNQFLRNKKSAEHRRHVVKKIASIVWAVAGLLLMLLSGLLIVLLIILAITDGSSQFYGNTVVQSDYNTISDVTAYLRQKETDLEESLQPEQVKLSYPDCYEYVYDIGPIGFNPQTLIAYLGAKFGTFSALETVRAELDLLFDEMYELHIEEKDELRDLPVIDAEGNEVYDEYGNKVLSPQMVSICYITLTVTPLEDVVAGRMSAEQKKIYDGYILSSGGQQVYGPVMLEDWSGLISSQFGERIHPITGVRTFHNGVDIAVPTGTKLYSAISGTVEIATYSDTAGYYVRVEKENGWAVVFMHMDSLGVSEGQQINQGDFVGYSGNTGNSTGPHLHLEVRDAVNNPVNPIFIIPTSCVIYQEAEEN